MQLKLFISASLLLANSCAFGQTDRDLYLEARKAYDEGNYQLAVEQIERAIAIERNEAYFMLRGDCFHKQEHFEFALADYNFADQIGYSGVELFLNRGICLVSLGMYEMARIDFAQVLRQQENATAYYYLGVIDYMNYDHKSAAENLNEAVYFNEEYMEAYYLRAATYAEWGKLQKARWDYEKAVELRPDFTLSKMNLAVVMIDMLDYDQAQEVLDELVAEMPENLAEVYYYRGEVNFGLRDFENACKDWTMGSELGDQDSAKNYELICEKKKDRIRKKQRTYIEF